MRLFLLGGAALLAVIIAGVIVSMNGGRKPEEIIVSQATASSGADTKPADPEPDTPAPRSDAAVLAEAEPLARKFLEATTIEEILPLVRDPETAESRILIDAGCAIETLDRDAAARADPALEPVKQRIAGALYAPGDESGDCRLFARNLVEWLKPRGVTFRRSRIV